MSVEVVMRSYAPAPAGMAVEITPQKLKKFENVDTQLSARFDGHNEKYRPWAFKWYAGFVCYLKLWQIYSSLKSYQNHRFWGKSVVLKTIVRTISSAHPCWISGYIHMFEAVVAKYEYSDSKILCVYHNVRQRKLGMHRNYHLCRHQTNGALCRLT